MEGSLPPPFHTGYSTLPGAQPHVARMLSHSIGSQAVPLSSSNSTDSSWSNASSRNPYISSAQYHHLLAQFNESQRENSSLLTKNTALEARLEALLLAYNMLLTRIPASTTTPNAYAALRREDYPSVRFWTRQDWNSATQEDVLQVNQPEELETFPELEEEGDELKESSALPPGPGCRGKHRSSQGINVTMKYIEFEDGTVADGFRAAEIRRYARSLWVQMALDEKLPKTWSDADAHSLTTYSTSMAQRFPELRLCSADWKANLVATDNYPSWRHNWLKRNAKDTAKSKRPSDNQSDVSMKRAKVAVEGGNERHYPVLKPEQVDTPNTMHAPTISVTPDTPARHQLAIGPVLPQEDYHAPYLQPPYQDLTFPIGSPLLSNALLQPSLPATSTLPPFEPDQTKNSATRSKGARMRPTKTTTARNLCAVEWVKVNPQGTTDEFKAYFNGLSEEQRLVWEEKSKATS